MKKIAFVFVLLLATLTTSAQKTVTPQLQEKIIAEINATAKGITSLQCDFVQTKTLSIMDERMVSKGKMVFARPNRFRQSGLSGNSTNDSRKRDGTKPDREERFRRANTNDQRHIHRSAETQEKPDAKDVQTNTAHIQQEGAHRDSGGDDRRQW